MSESVICNFRVGDNIITQSIDTESDIVYFNYPYERNGEDLLVSNASGMVSRTLKDDYIGYFRLDERDNWVFIFHDETKQEFNSHHKGLLEAEVKLFNYLVETGFIKLNEDKL